ncbi:queC 7-cyano-7-deazaguanine synthase [uncultured Caudovirales phage]|uniref:QueC 7-cyano-7-deazaguanine synthase n=1 Tax=uncultured Caudovirales phage TaxID=2100421 RepID=A0A6J5LNN5_9CAUD|nr:queC 7-cyano-7-deazaguanine synthase [uncultured Caudovirales phage]
MEPKTILAMYSGGLDSLGMIYKLLTEPEYSEYSVHIHHVHNRNIENRHRAEAIMVQQALAELTRLGFKYQYSESEIASQPYNEYFMSDSDSMNFFAGYICSANPNIVQVAIGMNATDSNHTLEERRKRANAILAAFTSVEKIYPVLNMSKSEIYTSLPETLKDLFWSCRRPVYTDSGVNACGECKTCKQLEAAGIKD